MSHFRTPFDPPITQIPEGIYHGLQGKRVEGLTMRNKHVIVHLKERKRELTRSEPFNSSIGSYPPEDALS